MTIRVFPPDGAVFGPGAFARHGGQVITAAIGERRIPMVLRDTAIGGGGAYADLTVECDS